MSAYDDCVLYGRQLERDRLSALLAASRDGVSGTVILLGGPGAGKSALLRDLQEAATQTVVQQASSHPCATGGDGRLSVAGAGQAHNV